MRGARWERAATAAVVCAAVMAGCGQTAPAAMPQAKASPVPTSSPTATGAAAPLPTADSTPTPIPPLLVAETSNGTATTISLVDLDGHTVASTKLDRHSFAGSATGGPGGAYWTDGHELHVLDRNGTVSDAGPLPSEWFRVGPDGSAAYSVVTPIAGSSTGAVRDQLFRLQDGATHLLAERISDPGHPTSDAPQAAWSYEAMAWNRAGLVIARVPLGGCGCGPFGMQTVHGYTGVVDVDTGVATPMTDDRSCPLSGVADDGTGVCFHTPTIPTSKDEGRGVDEVRIIRGGSVVQHFDMSKQNAAGDAVFSPDATQLAYATVAAGSECGSWQEQTALHVLDLQQGTAKVVGAAGLEPLAWLPDGRLLAKQSIESGGSVALRAVVLDVAAGTATTITTLTDMQADIAVSFSG